MTDDLPRIAANRRGWRGGSGLRAVLATMIAAAVSGGAAALPTEDDEIDAAVQTLADLTLIDAQCRNVTVSFGIGFAFAEEHGVSPLIVMPAGVLRKRFEYDLDRSRRAYTAETTCGALSDHYSIAVPGSVTMPTSGRGNGG